MWQEGLRLWRNSVVKAEVNQSFALNMERFSCRKSKANDNGRSKERKIRLIRELKVKPTNLPKAREYAGDQVVIGFSFESDWLREWHEFS